MNSRTTSQNMRFLSIEIPSHELPLKWSEALKMLEKVPVYE